MAPKPICDPELTKFVERFPQLDLTDASIGGVRELMSTDPKMFDVRLDPEVVLISAEQPLSLFVYNPPSPNRSRPAIIHLHGGGLVMGSAEMSRTNMPAIAFDHDAVVVSVDYRLAPEHPFPAALDDTLAALQWLIANSEELGVDVSRVFVMGESAGGGIAAALCLRLRDEGADLLAGQILIYPMLDYRTGGPTCAASIPPDDEYIWTRANNRYGWTSYRGNFAVANERAGWFSPALAKSCEALPPAFLAVGSIDLFRDEAMEYARRLAASGVSTELHVMPDGVHGFDVACKAAISIRFSQILNAALSQMMNATPPPTGA
ncbi:alpha/beta hydrolase [Croceicoccus ponticola]|uniref:Alpha/beta hydrolase n=1 Tax=Croceicoccus ponticola TaxID=2217664 RepID=A0A437GUK1_9SPHN|nr:alpha/beta hydrolase [Croceicoccus ponticola]RVQ65025.1 alpha/beta hydrolase [Croceicoccus ponticola]